MRRITKDIQSTIDGSPVGFRLSKLDAFSGVMLLRLLMRLEDMPPLDARRGGQEGRRGFTIRFHDLRHSFAAISLQNGDDIKTVSENLGHATVAFTLDVYGHVTDKMRRDSADRIHP